MKKKKNIRKFGREKGVRRALIKTLIEGLFSNGKIQTTEAKAREIRPFVEKLITLGKRGGQASKRLLTSRSSKRVADKVFTDLALKYEKRSGGYTRIIKTKIRKSDGAKMAVIEFV
jgi:large subunit ribosomal protein L17